MSSALDEVVNPRQFGLPRRQSYDSTKPPQTLSLGQLPPPSFASLPHGQRSVPALDATSSSARILGAHHSHSHHHSQLRSISGPLGDGQRTPGGSLVVGAEIFGFGSHTSPSSASTSKLVGTPRSSAKANLALADDPTGGWPSEFDTSTSKLHNRSRHSGDTASADLTMSGLSRPLLKSSGSSMELRSSTLFASAEDELVRIPQRPNASRAATGLPLEAKLNTKVPPVSSPLSATELRAADRIGNSSTSKPATPSYGMYESPAAGEYFSSTVIGATSLASPSASSSTRTLQASGFTAIAPGMPQMSPDELSLSMQGLDMNGSNRYLRDNDLRQQSTSSSTSATTTRAGSFASNGREPPSRQNSGGFPSFFVPPHMSQADPYSQSAFDAAAYFQAAGSDYHHGLRRDSGYAPSYQSTPSSHSNNIPGHGPYSFDHLRTNGQQQPASAMWPVAFGADYGANSVHNSRQGSFSYPSGMTGPSFGMNQSSGSPFESGVSAFQQNQMGQQHQIILGRGLRSSVDYIAPGPMSQANVGAPVNYSGYSAGYGHGYGAAETMGRALRSPMLEEFRTSRHRVWELSDILGHIVEFSGDQLGSRFIQQKLEGSMAEERAKVFEEVLPNLLQLSTDVFANYVIQKLFEQGNQLQKTAMANVLEGHVLQLSLQMYGCRVVQKALEYVLVEQQVKLIKELDGHVLKCARDAQSNHVIQRALERVPSNRLLFITDACVGQVHNLATHPYGCRVLQRIFENCPPAQTATLLEELHRSMQTLIQDQYGNYVVQWVIEKGDPADRSLVISRILGQVLPLAQQKFASNVVEKCVTHATDQERSLIIDEVLTPAPDGSSIIRAMLVHPYANYVVQKILNMSVGAQRELMFNEVNIQLTNIRKFSSNYSKHLIAIEKLLASERAARGMLY
ncbi:mRNA binding protein puf3 [Microbotryomycetes sp. JL201]|nr:mRNA binding protein puf3 [Microbotryomycetes sp. JL201]